MSILTKICVIVLVVLVLLACPIFITQATVAPNYRDAYEREQRRVAIAQQTGEAERLRAELLVKYRDDLRKQIEDLQQTLDSERQAAQVETLKLQREVAVKEGVNNSQQANLARLATVVDSDTKRIAELTDANTGARESISKLNKDLLDLKNLLDEVQGELGRQEMVNRVLREEKTRLSDENKELRDQMAAGPAPKTAAAPAAPITGGQEITGRVTAVSQDVASINIGKAKGVQRGMKMMIYRPGDFVAHLLIEEVDVGEAVGVIVDKVLEPRQGDIVSTIP